MPAGAGGALDFSRFDFFEGAEKLPITKLVDDFEASYDYVGDIRVTLGRNSAGQIAGLRLAGCVGQTPRTLLRASLPLPMCAAGGQ